MIRNERLRNLRRKWKRVRLAAEVPVARAVLAFFESLSDSGALRVGESMGRLAYLLFPRRRREALANLAAAFPAWSEAECERVARASAKELGRNMAEWLNSGRYSVEELCARVEVRGAEHFKAAVAKNRGVIVVTAHYGNWELLSVVAKSLLPDRVLAAVGRAFENEAVYRIVTERRSRAGTEAIPQSALAIRRVLCAGGGVGLLLDQYTPARRGGALVPFFGREAWTVMGPAKLAARARPAALPMSIRRLEGNRHLLEIGPEIELADSGDAKADALENARRFSAAIEDFIRPHPEHWVWSHHRWKHSPK